MKKKTILTLCTLLVAFLSFAGTAAGQDYGAEARWNNELEVPTLPGIFELASRYSYETSIKRGGRAGTYGLSHDVGEIPGPYIDIRLPGSGEDGVREVQGDGELCSAFDPGRSLSFYAFMTWDQPRHSNIVNVMIRNTFKSQWAPPGEEDPIEGKEINEIIVVSEGVMPSDPNGGNPFPLNQWYQVTIDLVV